MTSSKTDFFAILRKYNPWWKDGRVADLPSWRRTSFDEVMNWVEHPPSKRALLLSGARQIGKTTLLLQAIEALLKKGVPPAKILYVTFDHPLIKSISLDEVLELWSELEPEQRGIEYLFLDEIQYAQDWQVWLKHQVDFFKHRRIVVTGSAMPLVTENKESGVGRWHTLKLPTLSFFEYLQIKQVSLSNIPPLTKLEELFHWKPTHFHRVTGEISPLVPHFHEYLLRGGFPQSAQTDDIAQAQQLLREDIVDKIVERRFFYFQIFTQIRNVDEPAIMKAKIKKQLLQF